jgi:hypothetical protein
MGRRGDIIARGIRAFHLGVLVLLDSDAPLDDHILNVGGGERLEVSFWEPYSVGRRSGPIRKSHSARNKS